MNYQEEKRNLFTVDKDYYLAHCISADFGMGAGIVVQFNRRYDMKQRLRRTYPDYLNHWQKECLNGDCIVVDNVFNLITKERVYNKPTYASVENALKKCKKYAVEQDITKIAMPRIGCGLDGLEWELVSDIIKRVFVETDIQVLVCIWD